MTTGFKVGANDLDTLFMAYTTGTKVSATGFKVGATDLADLFQPIGAGTPIANTGFKVGATDLAALFRDISEPLDAVAWTTSAQSVTTTGNGSTVGVAGVRLLSDGNAEFTNGVGNWVAANGSTTFDWGSPAGSVTGSNFEYMWHFVSGTSLTVADGTADNYHPISSQIDFYYGAGSSSKSCIIQLTVGKIGDAGTRKTSQITITQDLGG